MPGHSEKDELSPKPKFCWLAYYDWNRVFAAHKRNKERKNNNN